MKKVKIIILLLSISISLNSCGVMFGGSKYNATIIAKNRPNADIYVNGQKTGKGTVTGLYPRNKPLTVEVKEEGCDAKTQTFEQAFRTGNFILSVISWGLLGLGVDLATGAAYKPDHKNNPAIQQNSTKDFTFTVESGCK